MKNFFGPFYEGADGLWHWNKNCPVFPTGSEPRIMVSTQYPKNITLCPQCHEADKNELKVNSFDKSKEEGSII